MVANRVREGMGTRGCAGVLELNSAAGHDDEHVGHAEPLAPRSGEESEECEGRGKNELRSREQPISGFLTGEGDQG